MFLTDCDGCLTDGGMYYSEKGDELKKFNTRDGMGFKLLREKGIITGIVTSENVNLNRRRAEKLKLNELIAGCLDKADAVKDLCKKYNIELKNVAYMGDDINDIEAMNLIKQAGGKVGCPADANLEVKEISDFISFKNGGDGAVREFIEWLIR